MRSFRVFIVAGMVLAACSSSSGNDTHHRPATPSASAHSAPDSKPRVTCEFDSRGAAKASNPPQCVEPGAFERYDITCSVDGNGTLDAQNAPACFPTQP